MSDFKIRDYVCDLEKGQEWLITNIHHNGLITALKWDDQDFGYENKLFHSKELVLRDVYNSGLYKAMSENESPQMEEK